VTPGDVRAGATGRLDTTGSNIADFGSERAYREWLRSLRQA
jgi:hypothetical protein